MHIKHYKILKNNFIQMHIYKCNINAIKMMIYWYTSHYCTTAFTSGAEENSPARIAPFWDGYLLVNLYKMLWKWQSIHGGFSTSFLSISRGSITASCVDQWHLPPGSVHSWGAAEHPKHGPRRIRGWLETSETQRWECGYGHQIRSGWDI